MEESTGYRGLCLNCRHAAACTYPKGSKQPVLQCEEYECVMAAVAAGRQARPKTRARGNPVPGLASNIKGLCANCTNFDSCTFLKPESGVWHCEEYQ